MLLIAICLLLIATSSRSNLHNTSLYHLSHDDTTVVHHNHLYPTLNHQKYFTMFPPNNTLLKDGKNIFGAVIVSDIGPLSPFNILANKSEVSEKKYNKIIPRIRNVQSLEEDLPFPLTKWNAIYTTPCPVFPNSHPTERGLGYAHYRIWKDFVYFDPVLLQQYHSYLQHQDDKNQTHEINTNISNTKEYLYSHDHVYKIHIRTGQRYKHHHIMHEMDRLVIFEEDAVNTIVDIKGTILEELEDMKMDLLFLGWCEGRTARPAPLCSHAYAITRQSARKLIQYYEPCGRGVDEQFVMMVKNGWLTYRRAHSYSYNQAMLNPAYHCPGDKTYGIFHQCKQLLGSVNNHR